MILQLGISSSRDPPPSEIGSEDSDDSDDSDNHVTVGDLYEEAVRNREVPPQGKSHSDVVLHPTSTTVLHASSELSHWITSGPCRRHVSENIMDGLTRLTPQTRTPDREGKTLKAILEEDTFRKSALLVRWSNPGQCFIHGDMYEAQLARCAWILERALVLPDRGIGQDGYNTYIGIVRKLASQYEKRSSVSEPPNAGKDDQLEVDWESDIVAIKKLSEGSLNVSESQWSFLVPNFDVQEYYRPAAGRKETSAPEGTANKKRKKPEAKAVA